ncbi:MAG: RNA pseudouridine synthase, partial [Nannocystis sp.]
MLYVGGAAMHDGEDGQFTIAEGDAGARLDVFLTRSLGCSRTRAHQAIEAGDVLVNGRAARPGHKLRIGDRIEAELAEATAAAALIPEALPLSVLHDDEELIVVDKPAGLVV